MNNYYEVRIDTEPCSEDITDLLAAFLAEEGFESFVADDKGLTAYIKEEEYSENSITDILENFPIKIKAEKKAVMIEGRDWNHEWEKNYYKPILIADRCVIRSSFHKDTPTAEIEILIDPKMAFGTGHHATTTMMVTHLLDNPPVGKRVIDMGTGTGILAILAEKLGAKEVTGIEIDPMAFVNAKENVELNGGSIVLLEGEVSRLKECKEADIFLANINRNIILQDLENYARSLRPGGVMYLSGFYPNDAEIIEKEAMKYSLRPTGLTRLGEWASLTLRKDL